MFVECKEKRNIKNFIAKVIGFESKDVFEMVYLNSVLIQISLFKNIQNYYMKCKSKM